jgi:hypothetical protein
MRPIRLTGQRQREHACAEIMRAPDGWVVRVSEPTRTLDQSARMWAMLGDLSKQRPMGIVETADGWKLLAMNAAGHECQFMQGLDGRPFPVGFRSSRLTVRQMTDLIDWLFAFGAEQGVVWSEPHPDERAA